jgi:ParB/RepB/Spo0J family partition protein
MSTASLPSPSVQETPNVQLIPVTSISDPLWNSRVTTDAEADHALIEDIAREGVKTAIRVRISDDSDPKNVKYTLVYGSRRLMAARAAKLPTIPADVRPKLATLAGFDPAIQAMMENVIENLQRKNLSPYETARAFADLRAPGGDEKKGFKLDDVVVRTGFSKPHISNMVTIMLKVSPKILEEWKNGNPEAKVSFLRELANTADHAVQERAFDERVKLANETLPSVNVEDDEEEEEDDSDSDRKKPDKKYHILVSRANKLKRALKAKKQPAISIAAVQYLIGLKTEIPGVISDAITDD